MIRYCLKTDLTDLEQAYVNIAIHDILLLIAEKRDYLLSLGILVKVEV